MFLIFYFHIYLLSLFPEQVSVAEFTGPTSEFLTLSRDKKNDFKWGKHMPNKFPNSL